LTGPVNARMECFPLNSRAELENPTRGSKRHLFVVDSLDKHMQNEKELIRLRRFLPAARTTLHQALKGMLKGGYFVFVWRVAP
jgi:hypothetical protein